MHRERALLEEHGLQRLPELRDLRFAADQRAKGLVFGARLMADELEENGYVRFTQAVGA